MGSKKIAPKKRTALQCWNDLEESASVMNTYHQNSRTYKFAKESFDEAFNELVNTYKIPRGYIAYSVRRYNIEDAHNG